MASRSDTFSRLLSGAINSIATYEGKTAPIIEEELGSALHLAGKTIQRYKSGNLPPQPRTIEVLAEAAVQRGYLGREWLQRFLHAARYPFADKLLDRLCPASLVRPRPPRVYENLPAPTYSQFVLRQQAFAEVRDGLQQRSAVVLIIGLGGNGKTSLAREVASQCLKADDTELRFEAVVWISDKDRPGATNLSTVLDETARTLDYPGFTQFAHDEKRYEVEQLLRRQRVLLVIDNFETITDGALLTWLLRLPEPSKAVVTSREYQHAWRSSWPVELRGMSETEAQALIHQRLHTLRLDTQIDDKTQLELLLTATGGNPKAIELAIGLMKYERRPLQQVVDDLYAARGELFDDLFTRAWALLDEAARRVLLVMTFFPANASSEALSATAEVQGFAFDRVIERLTDLALLDAQQEHLNDAARYTLHPLVQAFVRAKIVEQPIFEKEARKRWLQFYYALIDQATEHWHDLAALHILNVEIDNADHAVVWLFMQERFADMLGMSDIIGYYYYVRGLWNRHELLHKLRIQAARRIDDHVAESSSLLNMLRVRVLQGDQERSQQLINAIEHLIAEQHLPVRDQLSFHHGFAIAAIVQGDFVKAEHLLRQNMIEAQEAHPFALDRSRNWLADCLYQQGRTEEAKRLFEVSVQASMSINYVRSITFCQVRLAAIALEYRKFDHAETLLEDSMARAHTYQDRRDLSLIYHTYAKLYILRNELLAAHTSLTEAIDLYERLGMRRELAEARSELAQLEARAHTEAST